jgi:hypothetical protein
LLDEANKIIIIREKLIGDLNVQIVEFGSKIEECETQAKELKK